MPRDVQAKAYSALVGLRTNPRPPGVRELAGMKSVYRLRAGDHRIVYAIRDDVLTVLVLSAEHRSKVYGTSEMKTINAAAEAFRREDIEQDEHR